MRRSPKRWFAAPSLLLAGCVVFPPSLTVPEGGAIYADICWRGTDRDSGKILRGTVITLQPGTGGETLAYREEGEGFTDSATAVGLTIDRSAGRLRFTLPARRIAATAPDIVASSDAQTMMGQIAPDRIVLTEIDGKSANRILRRQTASRQAIGACPG